MTKRREKGEGSVYRRKDGRCVGEYEDANGKRRYVSGKTKAEARSKLRKLLADRDEGVAYDSQNLTVGKLPQQMARCAQGYGQATHLAAARGGGQTAPEAHHRGCEARQTKRIASAGRVRMEARNRFVATLGRDHPHDASQGAQASGDMDADTAQRQRRPSRLRVRSGRR
jgi:hypothetical protein